MVICRYFTEGRCRFGSDCRFEHPQRSRPLFHGSSEPYVHSQPQPPQSSILNSEYYYQIVEDIVTAERGKQWPHSCYAPSKDYPNLPDFEDTSPEEMRTMYYNSLRHGRNESGQYILCERKMLEEAERIRKFWKTPSPALERVLLDWLNTKPEPKGKPSESSFKFSEENSKSIFGGSSNQTSQQEKKVLLPNPSGIFSQQTSIFGGSSSQAPQTSGIFSRQTHEAVSNTQIFGGSSQSIFGGSALNASVKPTVPDGTYSREQDLSEDAKQAFLDAAFKFGKIPIEPPPRALC